MGTVLAVALIGALAIAILPRHVAARVSQGTNPSSVAETRA
jgi:hypothetical protein